MRCSNANKNFGLPFIASSFFPAQPISQVTTVHSNFSRAQEVGWLATTAQEWLILQPRRNHIWVLLSLLLFQECQGDLQIINNSCSVRAPSPSSCLLGECKIKPARPEVGAGMCVSGTDPSRSATLRSQITGSPGFDGS